MKFEMPKTLPEAAVRDIVRNAEAIMQPGMDAKEALVSATLGFIGSDFAFSIQPKVQEAIEMAQMIGMDDLAGAVKAALPELAAQLGEQFDKTLAQPQASDTPAATCAALLGQAAAHMKPVLPMNRGKFLSKFGIVDAHVKAIMGAPAAPAAPPTTPETVAAVGAQIEQPEVTDPEMRDMLGLPPLPGAEVPAAPAPFAAAPADGAVAPPPTNADAPSAVPHGPDAPPPPPPSNPRDAFVLMREATEVDDAELAKRLGISRSTFHNYMSGRTAKVKCNMAQARVMAAEIDVRVAKLRQAAEIFAIVRD